MKKLGAEFFGTLWLVLGGCGSAVLAGAFPELGIGFVGVSLAFGLTVLTMAYAIGHISGCHLNPAVSIGLWAGGRFSAKDLGPYIVAQVLGAIAAGGVLYLLFGDLQEALILLVPVSLLLGGLGLLGFLWALRSRQYDDLEGAAARILFDDQKRKDPTP